MSYVGNLSSEKLLGHLKLGKILPLEEDDHVPFTQGRGGFKSKFLCPIFLCPIQGREGGGKGEQDNVSLYAIFFFFEGIPYFHSFILYLVLLSAIGWGSSGGEGAREKFSTLFQHQLWLVASGTGTGTWIHNICQFLWHLKW